MEESENCCLQQGRMCKQILAALHAGTTMHCFGGAQQLECMPTMYHFPLTSQVYTAWCWFLTGISDKRHFSLWFLM